VDEPARDQCEGPRCHVDALASALHGEPARQHVERLLGVAVNAQGTLENPGGAVFSRRAYVPRVAARPIVIVARSPLIRSTAHPSPAGTMTRLASRGSVIRVPSLDCVKGFL
jgi:hypothetical protein